MDVNVIKDRLKEVFGAESQDAVGKKLNMTQGNVSKLLSGSQQPTLETVYQIAKTYSVSVDWLLGLSDQKEKIAALNRDHLTYADVVMVFETLYDNHEMHTGYDNRYNHQDPSILNIDDKILLYLLESRHQIVGTNRDIYDMWLSKMQRVFADQELIRWDGDKEKLYRSYFSSQDPTDSVVEKLKKMRAGTLDINGYLDLPEDYVDD